MTTAPPMPAREGWTTTETGVAYPPEPWQLGGRLLLAMHRVPVRELPASVAAATPAGTRTLRIGGHAIVGVAVVHYTTGGVLDYDELLVAVLGTAGLKPVSTIPQIWVDSPESMAGGRALWGIPKHLADFTRVERPGGASVSVDVDGEQALSLDATFGRALAPGLRRVPLTTAQRLEGRDAVADNVVLTRLRGLRGAWDIAADGPLGWLAGRTPVVQVAMLDAAITFGASVRRRPS